MWILRRRNKLLLVGFYHYQITGSNVEWSWSQFAPKLACLPFWSITQPHWDPKSWHNGGRDPTWSSCFVLKFTYSTSAELIPWKILRSYPASNFLTELKTKPGKVNRVFKEFPGTQQVHLTSDSGTLYRDCCLVCYNRAFWLLEAGQSMPLAFSSVLHWTLSPFIIPPCCCSIAKSCLTLWDPMCWRKGTPFPRPKSGLLSDTQKCIV